MREPAISLLPALIAWLGIGRPGVVWPLAGAVALELVWVRPAPDAILGAVAALGFALVSARILAPFARRAGPGRGVSRAQIATPALAAALSLLCHASRVGPLCCGIVASGLIATLEEDVLAQYAGIGTALLGALLACGLEGASGGMWAVVVAMGVVPQAARIALPRLAWRRPAI